MPGSFNSRCDVNASPFVFLAARFPFRSTFVRMSLGLVLVPPFRARTSTQWRRRVYLVGLCDLSFPRRTPKTPLTIGPFVFFVPLTKDGGMLEFCSIFLCA
uniref:Uncharacterized protein n=1 Tax=Trypanosoma vivax (strain Y486) TaxID=1055687 RepID=G0U3J5_TRYVY|nr:hypothetical protein TVY486_0906730 [Trypanosoma vivax Y486]